jgi:hypothetical protein
MTTKISTAEARVLGIIDEKGKAIGTRLAELDAERARLLGELDAMKSVYEGEFIATCERNGLDPQGVQIDFATGDVKPVDSQFRAGFSAAGEEV